MMGFDGYGAGWPGMGVVGPLLGAGMMLLFGAVLVLLLVWLVRAISTPRRDRESVRDVIDRRLAAGEITSEEHARLRQTLQV